MFERFTNQARIVVVTAQAEARDLRHQYIGTEHLLLALLHEEAGVAYGVLHAAGVERDQIRADVQRLAGKGSTPLGEDDAAALRTIGIDLDAVLARVEETFGPDAITLPTLEPRRGLFGRRRMVGGRIPFSQRAKKVLELSLREAIYLKHGYIGTEHILLGLIREGEGLAAKALTDAGVDLADLRRKTIDALREAA